MKTEFVPSTILDKVWAALNDDLKAIRQYPDDWDGFGAEAPDKTLVDEAINFLSILKNRDYSNPPFRVALAPSGSIAFEWQGTVLLRLAKIRRHNTVEWTEMQLGQKNRHWSERRHHASRR